MEAGGTAQCRDTSPTGAYGVRCRLGVLRFGCKFSRQSLHFIWADRGFRATPSMAWNYVQRVPRNVHSPLLRLPTGGRV
jgi:hypothetical protein